MWVQGGGGGVLVFFFEDITRCRIDQVNQDEQCAVQFFITQNRGRLRLNGRSHLCADHVEKLFLGQDRNAEFPGLG